MTVPFPYNQVVLDNYIEDATDNGAGNDKWTSTTVQTYTVPSGHNWLIYGGQVTRDANETLVVILQNDTPKTLMTLATEGAGTGEVGIFENLDANQMLPIQMKAGW